MIERLRQVAASSPLAVMPPSWCKIAVAVTRFLCPSYEGINGLLSIWFEVQGFKVRFDHPAWSLGALNCDQSSQALECLISDLWTKLTYDASTGYNLFQLQSIH